MCTGVSEKKVNTPSKKVVRFENLDSDSIGEGEWRCKPLKGEQMMLRENAPTLRRIAGRYDSL